jgi:hypothetical protein
VGHIAGYFYAAVILGLIVIVGSVVMGKAGGILAGLALVVLGAIMAAVSRRFD